MRTAFDPEKMEWRLEWPGRVARHDLVYQSPPEDPTQGLPIGNGDVGVLAWCHGSRLVMAINKCDLLDDPGELDVLRNWSAEQEELCPTHRHAGRIVVDFALPVFDPFYLSDFEARLSLADATLIIHAAGPLGTVDVRAFVDHTDGLLHASISTQLSEPASVQVAVQRYGSRTFGHWYAQVKRDPSVGLSGTQASADEGMAAISQELSAGTFALGCGIQLQAAGDDAPVEFQRRHSHEAAILLPAAATAAFELCAVVTSPEQGTPDQALAHARGLLTAASERSREAVHASHAAQWKEFWLRSLVDSGDDYLDNLWHLTMYYASASQRGRFPGRFIFGQWGWNRDVQHWTFYFHWNQQQVYWPLNAAGHHDLLSSYLEYRFAGLPHAREDARTRLNAPGAVVSDVADWHGRNSQGELDNHTPVAQIALDFWRQFQYTGDRQFLETRALPYLLEAAAFFESLFEKADDGLFHAREGTGYEGWIRMRDVITELACGQALFAATIAALGTAGVTDGRQQRWQDILDHMAPLPTVRPEGCFAMVDGQLALARGAFRGRKAFGDRALAAGWGVKEQRLLASKCPAEIPAEGHPDPYTTIHLLERNKTPYSALREDMKVYDGIFPFVEYAAVFPSGRIGLADQGAELYDLAVNTALLYAPDCMGWDPLPIVLARLGLADELVEVLKAWPSRWQYHCNGFGHYGPRDVQKAEASLRLRTNLVRDADDAQNDDARFPLSMWPFRHMGLESMSVLSCALNESLLQSHDGVIRVAPAVAASKEQARFTLHAAGGSVVSAQMAHGQPLWVAIEARQGGACQVHNPWPEAIIQRNGVADGVCTNGVLNIPTEPGDKILLVPDQMTLDTWEVVPEQPAANGSGKTCPLDWAQLGLPRMF
jgi:alpha-L-fucosidase 2